MTPADIATIALAAIGLVGIFTAILGWIFKRGGDERASDVALHDNTSAIKELGLELRRFRDEIIGALHDHDIRLTRLEIQPPPIHVTTKVEAPPHDSQTSVRDEGSG